LTVAILGLLAATVFDQSWTLRALGLYHGPAAGAVLLPLQFVALLGAVSAPINDLVLRRLLAIVRTVREGDAFVASNADRLHTIGWALLALQLISGAVWLLGRVASRPGHPLHLDAGFSAAGWLAVLLSFVLARVLAEGSRMREDVEGTI
jgi:hypothetical protein